MKYYGEKRRFYLMLLNGQQHRAHSLAFKHIKTLVLCLSESIYAKKGFQGTTRQIVAYAIIRQDLQSILRKFTLKST
jgi:hypothetical protein